MYKLAKRVLLALFFASLFAIAACTQETQPEVQNAANTAGSGEETTDDGLPTLVPTLELPPTETPVPDFPETVSTRLATSSISQKNANPLCQEGKPLFNRPFSLNVNTNAMSHDPTVEYADGITANGFAIMVESGIPGEADVIFCQGTDGYWRFRPEPPAVTPVPGPDLSQVYFPVQGEVTALDICTGKQVPPPPYTTWIVTVQGARRIDEPTLPSGTFSTGRGIQFDINYLCETNLVGPDDHLLFFIVYPR